MNALMWWLAGMGGAVVLCLFVGLGAALLGHGGATTVAVRVAVWLSTAGLSFAGVMVGIIVWCEVRAVRALEQSPRTVAVPSAASTDRVTFLPVAPSMSDRRKTPLVAVAGGKGVAGCSSKGVH